MSAKRCTVCLGLQPIYRFKAAPQNKDGFDTHCEDCRADYQKANNLTRANQLGKRSCKETKLYGEHRGSEEME